MPTQIHTGTHTHTHPQTVTNTTTNTQRQHTHTHTHTHTHIYIYICVSVCLCVCVCVWPHYFTRQYIHTFINFIWWCDSCFGTQVSMEYLLIPITPRLTLSGVVIWFGWAFGISTIVGHLMPNPFYRYISNMYNLVWLGLWHINHFRLFNAKSICIRGALNNNFMPRG